MESVTAAMHEGDEFARAVGIERRELVDVSPADESALAGPGDDHQPQLRIDFERLYRFDDLDHQLAVERVELTGIVDDEPRQIAALGPVLAGNAHAHCAFLRLEIAAFFVHSSRGLPRDARLKEARVDIIEDIAEIRSIYGEPMERAVKKQLPRLEKHSRAFIAQSPFLVMATTDPNGRCDASPKGDAPGFVQVVDDETLLIPDRLGNNRIDSIGNLISSPGVGLIFFVPGLRETLRVNGRARITTDPRLLEPLAVQGKVPRSGILVTAEEVYFHCGKALIRSDLWNPEKQLRKSEFPSLGRILADQIGGMSVEEAERTTAESYRTRLY